MKSIESRLKKGSIFVELGVAIIWVHSITTVRGPESFSGEVYEIGKGEEPVIEQNLSLRFCVGVGKVEILWQPNSANDLVKVSFR